MGRLNSPMDAWIQRMIRSRRVVGLHQSLFTSAAFLMEEGWSHGEVYKILRAVCDDVEDRYFPDREIYQAIEYAHRRITGEATPGMIWPTVSLSFRAEILATRAVDMVKLKASIPAQLSTLTYLHSLYKETDLLCIGRTAYEFRTVRLCDIPEDNRDLSSCEFINPSPMSSVAGPTESGDWSEHAKSNTGSRVYSVIEFDTGEPHEHAAILKYLATHLPLLMIVYSGSTSLHGWFKTSHVSEEVVERFYKEAVMLGADPKMFSSSQFSRLPMGHHAGTGRLQRVIFFNFDRVYYT